ncbi:MAG: GGDEF domain-containing protein [Solirubrobacterales bacterium]|nr:GGDEF domain-containing protein [Solirubrobacterales bacterium]
MPPRLRLGRLGAVVVLAWLAVMVAGAWVIANSEASSRRAMAGRLDARTRYAASFISIYARDLLARERSAARAWLASPDGTADTLARTSAALGMTGAVLLDAHGRAVVDSPRSDQPVAALLTRRYAGFAAAAAAAAATASGAGRAGASRISLVQLGKSPLITFAATYPSASGARVLAGAYAVSDTVLPSALDHMLSTGGWQAFLVDSTGGRLAAGQPGPRPADSVSFRAAVAGTPWAIVVNDPESQLYGFLSGPGSWVGWLALTGLTVAGLAIILLIAGLARNRTQLTALNDQLARLASVDPLTGLRNRRAIEEYLHDALSAARRHALPLSLLVVDVDHFKNFNDQLGHRSGDAVLAHTAHALDRALRAEDAMGRWGGEEFLVVLPGTDEEGAVRVAGRIRAALAADQPEEASAHGLSVTVTIGVAEWQQEEMSELVGRADRALYEGKAAGRDTAQVSTVMAAVTEVPERA